MAMGSVCKGCGAEIQVNLQGTPMGNHICVVPQEKEVSCSIGTCRSQDPRDCDECSGRKENQGKIDQNIGENPKNRAKIVLISTENTENPLYKLVNVPKKSEDRPVYLDTDLKTWWAGKCTKCGWRGLSKDAAGGNSIADTGDYDDVICPECLKKERFVPLEDDHDYDVVEGPLAEGTAVTSTTQGGTISGVICGYANKLLGDRSEYMVYIIRITHRTGKAWQDYPYSCITLPRGCFQLA